MNAEGKSMSTCVISCLLVVPKGLGAHLVNLGLGHEELRECGCVQEGAINELHCLCCAAHLVTVLGKEMDHPELHRRISQL